MASRSKPSLKTLRRRHERRVRRRTWIRRFCLAGIGILGAMLIFPAVQRFGFAYRESQLVESRLAELHQQHDALTVKVAERLRYRDYLRTAEAQEAQARHAGFHRQGEQVYLLSSDNP